MNRRLLLVLAVSFGLWTAACNGGIEGEDSVQVSLDEPADSRGVTLGSLCPAKSQSEPSTIRISNPGQADLDIQKISTKHLPDRLLFRGEETETSCEHDPRVVPSNDKNGDCRENQYCQDVADPVCVKQEFPDTPITIGPNSSTEFQFLLSAGKGGADNVELDCPDVQEDLSQNERDAIPDRFKQNYCGQITIETNSLRGRGRFDDGDVTLYFQFESDRSGIFDLSGGSLSFSDLEAGKTSGPKQFTVLNNSSSEPLEVTRLTIQNQPNLVKVSPTTPVSIPPAKSQAFDVTAEIPDDYDLETVQDDFINVKTSGINECTSRPVNVTLETSTESGPEIRLDKRALSFKSESTREISVENVGNSPLIVQAPKFDPSAVSSKYEVRYFATDGGNAKSLPATLQPGSSGTIEVEFTGDSGGVGEMNFFHNDESIGGSSTVRVLGKNEAGYGELAPLSANFLAGEQATRTFILWNLGTSDLTVDPTIVTQSPDPPIKASNFTISGFSSASPIAPGEFAKGTLEFDGSSASERVRLLMKMRTSTAGEAVEAPIVVGEKPSGSNLNAEINPLFDNKEVEVGATAQFDSSTSMGNSDTSGDYWYLLDRPDGSTFYNAGQGGQFAVRPDKAGTYIVGFTAIETTNAGTLQDQATFELTATDPSN